MSELLQNPAVSAALTALVGLAALGVLMGRLKSILLAALQPEHQALVFRIQKLEEGASGADKAHRKILKALAKANKKLAKIERMVVRHDERIDHNEERAELAHTRISELKKG